MNAENKRLDEALEGKKNWKRWGTYLSERAWGTVREDYSAEGSAWDYMPHDHARSKAYRWNEDGIAGICDDGQQVCFSVALWNENDPILKERIFGLTGSEGNHGEDVKDYYYYLDSTPTHSYMKYLYKYPQSEFPYEDLVLGNQQRGKLEKEFELIDTGIFDDNRYFDVFVEYAKADDDDICIKVSLANRGEEEARLRVLPTIWFRNTWSWENDAESPQMKALDEQTIELEGGTRFLYCKDANELLFTENETNKQKLYGAENDTDYVKDGINDFIVHNQEAAVNPEKQGTKASAHYVLEIGAGETKEILLRLSNKKLKLPFGSTFTKAFKQRKLEADEFYSDISPKNLSQDAKNVQRQAFAGMLWTKQFYHYDVEKWLEGDETQPTPPKERKQGRNSDWKHLNNADIISMPDK